MNEEQAKILLTKRNIFALERSGRAYAVQEIETAGNGINHSNINVNRINYAIGIDRNAYGRDSPTAPAAYRTGVPNAENRRSMYKIFDIIAFFEEDPTKNENAVPIFAFDHVKYN